MRSTEVAAAVRHAVCALEQYALILVLFGFLRADPSTRSDSLLHHIDKIGISSWFECIDPWEKGSDESVGECPDPNHTTYTHVSMRWRHREPAAIFR